MNTWAQAFYEAYILTLLSGALYLLSVPWLAFVVLLILYVHVREVARNDRRRS